MQQSSKQWNKNIFADNINNILKGRFHTDFKELQRMIRLILSFVPFAHYVDPFTTSTQEEKPYTRMNKIFKNSMWIYVDPV